MLKYTFQKAFTIVELLVVVVILGILTSLSTFSWNSWQVRTAETEVKSDLSLVASAMRNEVNFNNVYPLTLPSNFSPSSGSNIVYSGGSATAFCIDGSSKKKPNITLFVQQDGVVKKGTCSGGEIANYYSENTLVASTVTAGLNNSCTISLGNVYCWGSNSQGQLGNGSSSDSTRPVKVNASGVLAGKTVSQVASGYAFNCALAEGKVYCWGYNSNGQLGNGNTGTNSNVPVAVSTSGVLNGKTVTAIAAGDRHACALADAKAYCWGSSSVGQLGNGTSGAGANIPVAVGAPLSTLNVTAIEGGVDHTCAIANGQAYCWGSNTYGKLGDGSTTNRVFPVAVNNSGVLAGKTVSAIEGSLTFTCALANGLPYCWGRNDYGQMGNGTTGTDTSVPVAVNASGLLSGKTITSLAVSVNDACVIANSLPYCWGRNDYGQVGDNSYTNRTNPVATVASGVLSGKTLNEIEAGANYFCARGGIELFCWGNNNLGQFGNNTTTGSPVPVKVSNP